MPMKWDDGAVAMLCGTIVAILGTDGITQEQKDAIVERMNSAGYEVAWNGIRIIHPYKMPRFEDIKGDLFEAIWRVSAPTFGPEQQTAVIAQLKAKGIEMTWDAVRAPGLHEDLITVLLKQDIVSTENWKAVLAGMHEAQYQFTWRGFDHACYFFPPSFSLVSLSLVFILYHPLLLSPSLNFISNLTIILYQHQNITSNQTSAMATNSAGRTIWDDRARSVLLQAVMDVAPPSADQWESILEKVQESGYIYTQKAAFIIIYFSLPKTLFKMSGGRVSHRWDDKSDRDLLIAVVTELTLTPTSEQMKNIVQRCHEAGYTFTISAATQHLQKLKKKDPNGPGAATPSTPKGKKTTASAASSATKSTSKRGRQSSKVFTDMDNDEDDDFNNGSLAKKPKTEQKAETDSKIDQVKAEHVEEEDAI
ncbi:uncharacterized protein PgNI_09726 [Pyricularia grisea]|uniref:Uncharacterized protein n=1 Tax=Pyricularia grisea TaxID=148305 RepID=A0A6P8AS03_PYRGI|nr:uncharacterized protein PgNI_09726 [Pyricularia grisea]TLD04911.1 hypothetical protein PgNI_09726 [Pyricularia grisea]